MHENHPSGRLPSTYPEPQPTPSILGKKAFLEDEKNSNLHNLWKVYLTRQIRCNSSK